MLLQQAQETLNTGVTSSDSAGSREFTGAMRPN